MPYLEQVYGHVPLSAIRDNFIIEMSHDPIVQRKICGVDGKLEEVVAFVELVPKERIGLYTVSQR